TGERVLDLGCGTGDLTKSIKDAGVAVIGIDGSSEMIARAQEKFADIDFRVADARDMKLDVTFDAIFSNAVLHWIPDQDKVAQQMNAHLKPGGRIVVEFGGKGNNQQMIDALHSIFKDRGYNTNASINAWFFPSIAEYSTILERHGFRVILMEHFDRPTPLKGVDGIKDWFKMFGDKLFTDIPEPVKEDILNEVQFRLEPTHLLDGVWIADYKRIRAIAIKE
ncbi:MAG: methyltransferase domain-containing protein, partial [Chryseolinea sp.]